MKDLRSSTLVSSSTPGGLYILPACTCCQALVKPRVHNTHIAQQTAEQLNLQHVGGWKVSSCHCKLCIMAPKYQTSNMHSRSGANANMLLCVLDTLRWEAILNTEAATSSLAGVAAALMMIGTVVGQEDFYFESSQNNRFFNEHFRLIPVHSSGVQTAVHSITMFTTSQKMQIFIWMFRTL